MINLELSAEIHFTKIPNVGGTVTQFSIALNAALAGLLTSSTSSDAKTVCGRRDT